MKQLITIYLLALFLALATSALAADGVQYASLDVQKILIAADEMKFASVDVQKILTHSYAGREANKQLEMNALKAEIEKNSREKELNKLLTELQKPSYALSETERSAKEKIYENKLQEYQQFIQKIAEEIRSENAELTSRIVRDIIKVVQDYGRQKGYLFIFFKNDSVLYLDDKVDVTDAILQALNAK